MTEEDVKKRLAQLAMEIKAADEQYYQDDAPVLTDAQYDALRRENNALESAYPHLIRADSPSKSVGAKLEPVSGIRTPLSRRPEALDRSRHSHRQE